VSTAGRVLKRLLIGQPFTNDKLGDTLLPKRIALPVFASDALSSVAYAPDEIFITLSVAGLSAYAFSWKVGLAVAIVMLTIVASYRQNVHAYPSGGGDYEVATTNIGSFAGLTVASALLVDYVLTVAVSVSSGVQNATSALPIINGHESVVATALVILLMSVNLRGIRESGSTFAVPTYCFMVAIIGMVAWGLARQAFGHLPPVDSAKFTINSDPSFVHGLGSFAGAFLILRTFSSGCAALTGVEAISNGVPAFRKPKSKNAATTLLLMGVLSVTMLIGIITLANLAHLRYVDPDSGMQRLILNGKALIPDGSGAGKLANGATYDQQTVIGQLAHSVFSNFSPAFYFTIASTGIILILAANTAFNGFPVLASILARDGFLPRQLHTRGDRLAFSNGIVILAGAAIVLIIAFNAQPTRLIQLYIIGVFVSFTTSQIGMIRHWNRHLKSEQDRRVRGRMMRSRAINALGAAMSGTVLVVVLVTKFAKGAWIAIAAMAVLFVMMRGIKKHYTRVQIELQPDETVDESMLPSRVHAIVLVSKIHKPTLRALVYARATRPSILEAVTVNVETDATKALQAEWSRRDIQVPLKILDSPYREVTRPILEYVKSIRRGNPRDVVMVYIPEYIVGHWWEQLLHNQSALRLKGRLLFTPGVMVASVPWQLDSTEHRKTDTVAVRAGTQRRGTPGAGSGTTGDHPVAPEQPTDAPTDQPTDAGGPIGDATTPRIPS
jgi:amino acid transporter